MPPPRWKQRAFFSAFSALRHPFPPSQSSLVHPGTKVAFISFSVRTPLHAQYAGTHIFQKRRYGKKTVWCNQVLTEVVMRFPNSSWCQWGQRIKTEKCIYVTRRRQTRESWRRWRKEVVEHRNGIKRTGSRAVDLISFTFYQCSCKQLTGEAEWVEPCNIVHPPNPFIKIFDQNLFTIYLKSFQFQGIGFVEYNCWFSHVNFDNAAWK